MRSPPEREHDLSVVDQLPAASSVITGPTSVVHRRYRPHARRGRRDRGSPRRRRDRRRGENGRHLGAGRSRQAGRRSCREASRPARIESRDLHGTPLSEEVRVRVGVEVHRHDSARSSASYRAGTRCFRHLVLQARNSRGERAPPEGRTASLIRTYPATGGGWARDAERAPAVPAARSGGLRYRGSTGMSATPFARIARRRAIPLLIVAALVAGAPGAGDRPHVKRESRDRPVATTRWRHHGRAPASTPNPARVPRSAARDSLIPVRRSGPDLPEPPRRDAARDRVHEPVACGAEGTTCELHLDSFAPPTTKTPAGRRDDPGRPPRARDPGVRVDPRPACRESRCRRVHGGLSLGSAVGRRLPADLRGRRLRHPVCSGPRHGRRGRSRARHPCCPLVRRVPGLRHGALGARLRRG